MDLLEYETPELLESLLAVRTVLRRFPKNCTHLIQPLDQLILRLFKVEWRKRWDAHKFESIIQGNFTETGRIKKPPHSFYLNLVKEVVDALNNKIIDGISLACKAMIICGLAPSTDGIWRTSQLTHELREIVEKHPDNFNGLYPNSSNNA